MPKASNNLKNQGRIPFNYYRKASAGTGKSPFDRRLPKSGKVRKYFLRSLDILVIMALLLVLIYSLFINASPKIELNSNSYHNTSIYQTAAAKYLGTITNRNKITLNENQVITNMQKQFPEIENAQIELPVVSETPIIHLTIAKPSFFMTSANSTFVIDSEGVAVAPTKDLPQIKNLNTITDKSGFKVKTADQVLSTQSVDFINNLLAQTSHAKVPIKSLVLPTQLQELDLFTSDHPYYVKFFLGGDVLTETGQFIAARQHFDQTGKQPNEYLDVRVSGKIFYK